MLPTKRAKDIFKQKANQVIAMHALSPMDLELLALYANSLDMAFVYLEKVNEPPTPRYDKDDNIIGYTEPPYFKMYCKMVEIVNKIGADFGFSPLSRQRINAAPPEKEETIDDILG